MAIRLDCPRCRKPLSVPRKKAGHYANCPRCGGRFWVPQAALGESAEPDDAVAEPAGGDSGVIAPPQFPAPPVGPAKQSASVPADPPDSAPAGQPATVGPGEQATVSTEQSPAAEPAPAAEKPKADTATISPATSAAFPKPEAKKNTARFVSGDATASSLRLADDGRLPELHLREEGKSDDEPQATTINPLALFGLLTVSVVLSIAIVMFDPGAPQDRSMQEARRQIEETFFPRQGEKPLEYQELLMTAQRAHGRGDRKAEQQMYTEVLGLLRQQRPGYVDDEDWSLTTSPELDKKLDDLICTLLGDD